MYIVNNKVTNMIVGNFKTEAEFVHFMRNIAVENDDEEMSITCLSEAKEYIDVYCDNLELLSSDPNSPSTNEKDYIIVGDNNFWYSTFKASTMNEIEEEINQTKELISYKVFDAPECTKLFVYETSLVKEINL